MTLQTGTHLGPYEILGPIGAGGMGDVYRATDTRLGRDVAIKISAQHFSDRFEREARAVAALNHPNVCTLHDVGPDYLVMELVEGETLAERILHGPIPIAEGLRIATQIADALEAAHDKGIVHRDLKPANVKIKPDGTVKVLDFGLAKTVEGFDRSRPENASGATLALANSPTFAGATQAGMILGTAAYMSPEQARGKVVDKRADIWAFGCVVFELLTGTRAFDGETVTDTLASLMKNEPDWSALPPATPTLVRSVLRRCLQKDPSRRLHDVADARIEIQEALAEPEAIAPTAPIRRTPRWTIVVLTVLAGLFAATTAWLYWQTGGRGASITQPPTHVEVDLPGGVESYVGSSPSSVAVSPDGRRIAYVGILDGDRQVYIRHLDGFDSTPVKGTDMAASLFFSPDGRSLGMILTSGALKTVSLEDGLTATLIRDADYTTGGVWGSDGQIIFGRNDVLWQVPASGGTPIQLTTLDKTKSELQHREPAITPDGKAVLFAVAAGSRRAAHIEAMPIGDPGRRHVIVESGTNPIHAASGHVIFLREGAMLAAVFDSKSLQVRGAAIRVVNEVRVSTLGSAMMAAVSNAGTMAYMNGAIGSQLVWVSRQGVEGRITDADRPYASPVLAPNGARRLVAAWNGDVWIQDVERGTGTRLTTDATAGSSYPIWTPDGKRVVFRSVSGMQVVDVDGSGRLQALPGTSFNDYPNSVSPDGAWLAFLRIGGENGGDVYVMPLNGESKARALVSTPAYEGGAQFSPDGKWLAFASDESGHYQVFVRPFAGENRKWLVSQIGRYPRWSGSGKELFYRDGNKMMAVDVSIANGQPAFSAPRLLFDKRYQFGSAQVTSNYDVSADGQQFVMVKDDPASNRLNVILNWFDELKRLVPVR